VKGGKEEQGKSWEKLGRRGKGWRRGESYTGDYLIVIC
jgi:hypothetical protein